MTKTEFSGSGLDSLQKEKELAIEFINVGKSYGKKEAISNISFSIKKGTIHGFIGPNGSGKTTTMKCIVKLSIPDKGIIKVYGKSVAEDPWTNSLIGFVSAETESFEEFQVEDLIVSYNTLRGLKENEIKKKIFVSPLSRFRFFKMKELSTGWKKIVQLFMITLSKPPILLFDEPFNGLDPIIRQSLFRGIQRIKEEGKTVLLSTHILSDLQKLADEITIIEEGKIVYSGPKTEDIEKTYEKLFLHKQIKNKIKEKEQIIDLSDLFSFL